MVTAGAVAGVAVIAFGLVITPGPNLMYLVSRSISQGPAAGFTSLAGVIVGLLCYVAATAAGLAVLFAAVPELFLAVKIAGALYLLWLAWGIVRGGRRVFGSGELPNHSPRRLFNMGLATCLLNPKVALMYAALLPQFVDPGRGLPSVQIMLLGLVQVAVAATVNALWVLLAATAKSLFNRSELADRVARWVTGSLLGGFAVHLGLSQPTHA
ncbi:LysE family translocator [Haloactinopolyspora sp.]|uniref:LysE family translocator n=1 Tax=Haloactinopolyspora sp. TaxID=1966353 RepID=UPI00341E7072